jgi:hypothetical protein
MAMLPLMGSATIDPARRATYIANHMCEHICEPILQLVAYCRASRALQCALKTALTLDLALEELKQGAFLIADLRELLKKDVELVKPARLRTERKVAN